MAFDSSAYHRYRSHYTRKLKVLPQEPVAQATLVLIFSLLTISFFAIFAIRPTLSTIAELIRAIKDKKEISFRLQNKIEALSQAQVNYEKLKPHLEKIEKTMPQEALFLHLVAEINLLAWENQVVLDSGNFGDFVLVNKGGDSTIEKREESKEATASASESNLSELVFSLKVNGEYKNLKKFVKELNKIDRLVVIEETVLSTDDKVEETSLAVELKVKAFYLKQASFYSKNGKT